MEQEKKTDSKFVQVLKKTFKIDPSDFSIRSILVVFGTFMIGFVALGIGNMAISQFVNPMAEYFGVGRSTINVYATVTKIAGMLTAIAFPSIYKRVGPKGIALCACIPLALQFVIWALAPNLTWIYIGSFIGGIGVQCGGGMMIFAIIKPWFSKNLGIFAALCGTSSGLGSTIFTLRIADKIAADGWKSAAWMVAILVAVLAIIPFLMVRANDKDPLYHRTAKKKEGENEGEKAKKTPAPALTYRDYIKFPASWCCIAQMFLAAATTIPFMKAMNGVAEWKGFDAVAVGAVAFALFSFWQSWAKIGMGIMRDMVGMKFCQIFAWGLNIISMAGMLFIPNMSPGMFKFLATINCFASTATQLGIGFMLVQCFGKYYNPRIYSLVTIFFNIGRAAGEPLIQLPYDLTGSYAITLWGMLIVGILMLVLSMLTFKFGKQTVEKMDRIYTEKGYDIHAFE